MRSLKTHVAPQPRTVWVKSFHPDILRLLDVFTCIERRRQVRLREIRAGEKHSLPE